ncbi:MAG: hypothetical protein HY543_09400, partial [Deltaproteobacteria bacterium]|nr:hypothetical protein [Deltaproteobacteria bacterium]
ITPPNDRVQSVSYRGSAQVEYDRAARQFVIRLDLTQSGSTYFAEQLQGIVRVPFQAASGATTTIAAVPFTRQGGTFVFVSTESSGEPSGAREPTATTDQIAAVLQTYGEDLKAMTGQADEALLREKLAAIVVPVGTTLAQVVQKKTEWFRRLEDEEISRQAGDLSVVAKSTDREAWRAAWRTIRRRAVQAKRTPADLLAEQAKTARAAQAKAFLEEWAALNDGNTAAHLDVELFSANNSPNQLGIVLGDPKSSWAKTSEALQKWLAQFAEPMRSYRGAFVIIVYDPKVMADQRSQIEQMLRTAIDQALPGFSNTHAVQIDFFVPKSEVKPKTAPTPDVDATQAKLKKHKASLVRLMDRPEKDLSEAMLADVFHRLEAEAIRKGETVEALLARKIALLDQLNAAAKQPARIPRRAAEEGWAEPVHARRAVEGKPSKSYPAPKPEPKPADPLAADLKKYDVQLRLLSNGSEDPTVLRRTFEGLAELARLRNMSLEEVMQKKVTAQYQKKIMATFAERLDGFKTKSQELGLQNFDFEAQDKTLHLLVGYPTQGWTQAAYNLRDVLKDTQVMPAFTGAMKITVTSPITPGETTALEKAFRAAMNEARPPDELISTGLGDRMQFAYEAKSRDLARLTDTERGVEGRKPTESPREPIKDPAGINKALEQIDVAKLARSSGFKPVPIRDAQLKVGTVNVLALTVKYEPAKYVAHYARFGAAIVQELVKANLDVKDFAVVVTAPGVTFEVRGAARTPTDPKFRALFDGTQGLTVIGSPGKVLDAYLQTSLPIVRKGDPSVTPVLTDTVTIFLMPREPDPKENGPLLFGRYLDASGYTVGAALSGETDDATDLGDIAPPMDGTEVDLPALTSARIEGLFTDHNDIRAKVPTENDRPAGLKIPPGTVSFIVDLTLSRAEDRMGPEQNDLDQELRDGCKDILSHVRRLIETQYTKAAAVAVYLHPGSRYAMGQKSRLIRQIRDGLTSHWPKGRRRPTFDVRFTNYLMNENVQPSVTDERGEKNYERFAKTVRLEFILVPDKATFKQVISAWAGKAGKVDEGR